MLWSAGLRSAGTSRKDCWRSGILLSLLLVVVATTVQAEDGCPENCYLDRSENLEGGDELWLVNTRHLSCPDDDIHLGLDVNRYDSGSGWRSEQLASLAAAKSDDHFITVFYVHGNRMEWYHAEEYGWIVYHTLRSETPLPVRLRLVIWSWPSNRMFGPVRDARVKAARADVEAHYFANFLAQLPFERRSILTFSLGGRIVTGALTLLQGGEICGRSLAVAPAGSRSPVHVAMLAPALHNHWITPGGRDERALDAMASLLIFYNRCDPALKRYHIVENHSKPRALGYWGISTDCLAARHVPIVRQVNVCETIGKSHDELRYYCSAWITHMIREQLGQAAHSIYEDRVPPVFGR